jgi:hypothetical protein
MQSKLLAGAYSLNRNTNPPADDLGQVEGAPLKGWRVSPETGDGGPSGQPSATAQDRRTRLHF